MMDTKQLIEALNKRKVVIDGRSDGRGGWYSHEEPDPLCQEAIKKLEVLTKVLDRINEGLQTGETRDALVEAKYLIIDA